MRISTLIRHLEKRMEALGKERDKLRDLYDEVGDARDHATLAVEDLGHVIESLSEIV